MGEIVVGVDGSAESLDALRWAQSIAAGRHTVKAVHVWVYPLVGGDVGFGTGVGLAIPYEELQAGAQELLDEVLAAVPADGVDRTEELINAGSPSGGLLDAAKDADLVVVGTHRHSTFGRIFVGSTAIQVAHHAPCPFVAVPVGAGPLGDLIAIAYDSSEHARDALVWATGFAADRGLRVRVVTVWERLGWQGGPRVADPPRSDEEVALDQLREEVAPIVDAAGVEVEYHPVHATSAVAEHLLEAADGAGMLVMGSRGRGGFTGLLLGSVSQRCLESARLPVAIVRS